MSYLVSIITIIIAGINSWKGNIELAMFALLIAGLFAIAGSIEAFANEYKNASDESNAAILISSANMAEDVVKKAMTQMRGQNEKK